MYELPIQICWEITQKCNLNCIYCLNSSGEGGFELSDEKISDVVNQISECNPLDLIISGGEPLIKKDFFNALEKLKKTNCHITLLTNGTLINNTILKTLYDFVDVIQISLDSLDEFVQDKLAGAQGAYKKIFQGIEKALSANLNVAIGSMITKLNYSDIPKIADFCIKNKIKHLSLSTLMPIGRALKNYPELSIGPEERVEVIKNLLCFKHQLKISGHEPALAFILGEKENYICDGLYTSIAISADGFAMPCGYIREKINSVQNKRLKDIWKEDSPKIRKKLEVIPEGKCSNCSIVNKCRGGCKAFTYCQYKRPDISNPICVFDKF